MTRRDFARILGVAGMFGSRIAHAADPDFTLEVYPDTQYMAFECTGMFAALVNRTISDQSAWNIKAVIGVGDCQHNAPSTVSTPESLVVVNAYGLLDAAGIPAITPPGNHDYISLGSSIRSNLGWAFLVGGFFSAATRAAWYGAGRSLGAGDMAYWVGAYDASGANTAIRLCIGSRRTLVIALEYFPQSAVLNWARGLHDTWAARGYEVIVTTHGFLDRLNNLTKRTDPYGPAASGSNLNPAPDSNSGVEMWQGYNAGDGTDPSDVSWAGFRGWRNCRGIVCGHDIDPATQGGSYWQRKPLTNDNGNVIQAVFANMQQRDNITSYCPSGVLDGATDVGHIFRLKFRPSLGTVEGYMLSANAGLWATGSGNAYPFCTSATPVNLFGTVAWEGVPPVLGTTVSGAVQMSGGGTVQ